MSPEDQKIKIQHLERLHDVSRFLRDKITDYKARDSIADSPNQRKAVAIEKAVNDILIGERSKISSTTQTIVMALNISTRRLHWGDTDSLKDFKQRFSGGQGGPPSDGPGVR